MKSDLARLTTLMEEREEIDAAFFDECIPIDDDWCLKKIKNLDKQIRKLQRKINK